MALKVVLLDENEIHFITEALQKYSAISSIFDDMEKYSEDRDDLISDIISALDDGEYYRPKVEHANIDKYPLPRFIRHVPVRIVISVPGMCSTKFLVGEDVRYINNSIPESARTEYQNFLDEISNLINTKFSGDVKGCTVQDPDDGSGKMIFYPEGCDYGFYFFYSLKSEHASEVELSAKVSIGNKLYNFDSLELALSYLSKFIQNFDIKQYSSSIGQYISNDPSAPSVEYTF